jgi:hypothetical protein
MLDEVFVHLEHAHLVLAPEDILELVIRQNLALVLGALETVGLNVAHTLLTISLRGSGELN